jgi:integrase/recombinase XerD
MNSKNDYYTILDQAKDNIKGFNKAYSKFLERVTIDQNSESMITNYSRSIAHVALHFGTVPHKINTEDINSYLYKLATHEILSISYFKQTVFGLRHWFRLFGQEEKAVMMPSIKKTHRLPTVLSKEECIELIRAPRLFKHRFLLSLAYSAGLRMNELRMLKIADVDLHRKQIKIRQGKGKKDRYTILSNLIASNLNLYLCNPS